MWFYMYVKSLILKKEWSATTLRMWMNLKIARQGEK